MNKLNVNFVSYFLFFNFKGRERKKNAYFDSQLEQYFCPYLTTLKKNRGGCDKKVEHS